MRNRQKKATNYAGSLTVAILGAVVVGTAAIAVPPTKAPPTPVPGLTDLGILENRFFSHPYAHDPVDKRLERLECMVFGGIQAGTPEDRLSKLIKVVAQRAQTPIREEKAAVTENQEESSASKTTPSAPSSVGKSSAQYPVLNTLEWRALKKTYATDSLDQRLDRLESKTFGQPAQGMAYADRVDRLRRTLGIGIDTGVGNNPLTAGGIGPAPRARAGGDGGGSTFGYDAPLGGFPGGNFGFGFPAGMDLLFDATFDKQFSGMMQQMNKQMEDAMRLGPGRWRFDPRTNAWVDLDTGRKRSPTGGDVPRIAPGPRSFPLPPTVAPQRRPNVIEDVPPYADPNSI
ncbi:MAG: hypothetical protein K2W95_23810 [Candidatus Obscuribacterales bacterium]|nr:hypothetical protein [Candidatus Obscuribacterales bacterium]